VGITVGSSGRVDPEFRAIGRRIEADRGTEGKAGAGATATADLTGHRPIAQTLLRDAARRRGDDGNPPASRPSGAGTGQER